MSDKETVLDLLNTAQATAKDAKALAAKAESPVDMRAAAEVIEHTAIDIISVFEARMQHHFKRGPFFKELQKRLNADNQTALGTSVIQYSHAANVLKHGHGKSHRALLDMKGLPFKVRQHDRNDSDIGLVDVLSPGFFDGLIAALKDAYTFLDSTKD